MPTGTGWIDPAALDTLEYLLHGDVGERGPCNIPITSWLSLLSRPGYGAEAADALFDAVYGYWTTAAPGSSAQALSARASLGAMNSQGSVDLFDVISDPFQARSGAGAVPSVLGVR